MEHSELEVFEGIMENFPRRGDFVLILFYFLNKVGIDVSDRETKGFKDTRVNTLERTPEYKLDDPTSN